MFSALGAFTSHILDGVVLNLRLGIFLVRIMGLVDVGTHVLPNLLRNCPLGLDVRGRGRTGVRRTGARLVQLAVAVCMLKLVCIMGMRRVNAGVLNFMLRVIAVITTRALYIL